MKSRDRLDVQGEQAASRHRGVRGRRLLAERDQAWLKADGQGTKQVTAARTVR